ncbi:sensor histidine kinase [Cupriavidus metallidurans]|uniref:sensor histidine kinase n=1 Tax=Cupriavidus metallidurans TaxID=119219 RepID=UPI00055FB7E9|nr:sensor histidine kinase [Cupriavidus metallidurans]
MYAILPSFVSAIFLGYGLYVLSSQGVTRVSTSFFLLCAMTFAWQGSWAFLFGTETPNGAMQVARFGYLFILFLPTTFYHFVCEVTESRKEWPLLIAAYGVSLVLSVLLMSSDLVVSGYYTLYFGKYPKAGLLHPIHIMQTVALALRCAWLLLKARANATAERRRRFGLCLLALGLFSLAAVDYAVNFGARFYPPGVFFIVLSLGVIAFSVVRYDLMRPYSLAATVAHEVRTPLATIRMQLQEVENAWPHLHQGYIAAVENGILEDRMRPGQIERTKQLIGGMSREVDGTSAVIDMTLASLTLERLDRSTFAPHGLAECVAAAIERYPLMPEERARVHIRGFADDWKFVGSDTLLIYVLFNLLKNSLYAIHSHGSGNIEISGEIEGNYYLMRFHDTGPGIPASILPRLFEPFFSTKAHGRGHGLGLSFCRRVMEAFGGRIECASQLGAYTTFTLRLPRFRPCDSGQDQPLQTRVAG